GRPPVEVGGERLGGPYPAAAGRVGEGELPGVEEGTGEAEAGGQGGVGAVGAVAGQGVAEGCQVDPDLMGAAGLQGGLDQLDGGEGLQDLPVGDGGAAAGVPPPR